MEYTEEERKEAIATMAAGARRALGKDFPIEITPTGIRFPRGLSLQGDTTTRPGDDYLQRLIENTKEGDEFLKRNDNNPLAPSHRCNLLRNRAGGLLKKGEYRKAAEMYLAAAEAQCRTTLPPSRARSKIYMKLGIEWEVDDVVACLTGAAKALMELGDYTQLQEGISVYRNGRDESNKNKQHYEWFYFHVGTPHHYLQYSTLYKTLGDVYLKLGNTGAAVSFVWQSHVCLSDVPPHLENSEHKRLRKTVSDMLTPVTQFWHPEPSLTPTLEVIDDSSQVRGSWKRIELRKPGGVTNRMGNAMFVHKGYLYTVGGEKFQGGPYYPELWRLNLSKMDAWEALPKFPISERRLLEETLTGPKIAVGQDDKAYYFLGSQNLPYYDINSMQWKTLRTRYECNGVPKKWPYPDSTLQDFAIKCVGNKLYVFGGRNWHAKLGCNLLMELDIPSANWRRLSGEFMAENPSFTIPGPRINPCTWVSKDQTKIMLMYGDANRMGAKLSQQKHGAMTSHEYDDIWSWDIRAEKWTREKFVGNGPSPRTEMACAYNPVLDKVITFGGYSPTAPTAQLKSDTVFRYSYYADTFICDIQTPKPASHDPQTSAASFSSSAVHKHRYTSDACHYKWRQVLTRGFPTYRAQAHLIVDPDTGKTYLFGGYINSEFVPTNVRNNSSRSFCDIWELRVDLPDGGFEKVNLEEEARTAKAGPWQRCFGCGSAGPWKKCGGSCNGRVFFCGSQCLKDGWKEHKEMHRCRKVN